MEAKKNTLLIVDDESANLRVLTHILGDDYQIFTAKNGSSAIEILKELLPDLILLDIVMPEMDGYETLSIIKKTKEIKHIPVVFISGLDSDEYEEKGLALGAADYITKPFSATVVKLRVRHQIQIVNQLRTIENLSMIDQLTNIPNRRCFDNHLDVEWKQAVREQLPISLLMIDLDRFKNLNDTYGHLQGDIVLKAVASILTASLKRPADFTARWGGEEFTVLLPNTHLEGAIEVAETIRAEIENTAIPFSDGTKVNITVSIGVTSAKPDLYSSVYAFFSNVDKALYMAKDAGRNKVAQLTT